MKGLFSVIVLATISLFAINNRVTANNLTHSVTISLLTQDDGEELYAYFGHTAIRVKDDSLGVDQVYNYGTFDFNTPNFHIRFIKGDLDYCLSIDSYDFFVYMSAENKRTIREQVINLSFEEKCQLVMMLETCYNTSDRYYRYDFLDNNCATKISDIISEATKGRIDFRKSDLGGSSYRQLLKPFLKKNYWIDLGLNLILGLRTDQKANSEQYMFLPIYIHNFFDNSEYANQSTVILDASPVKKNGLDFGYILPWLIALVISGFILWKKTRKFTIYFILSIFALLGLLVLSLGIYSNHEAVSTNLNVLWTLPALFVLIFGHSKKYAKYFNSAYLIILLLHLINWFWLPQQLSLTFLPWMFLMTFAMILETKAWLILKKKF